MDQSRQYPFRVRPGQPSPASFAASMGPGFTEDPYPAVANREPTASDGGGPSFVPPPEKRRPVSTKLILGCLAVLAVVLLGVGSFLLNHQAPGEATLALQPTSTVSELTPLLPALVPLHASCSGNSTQSLAPLTFTVKNTDEALPLTWSTIADLASFSTIWGTVSPSHGTIPANGSVELTLTLMPTICQYIQHQGGSLDYTVQIIYSTLGGSPALLNEQVTLTLN